MKTLSKGSYSNLIILIICLFCPLNSIFAQGYAIEFKKKQIDSLKQDVVYLYINPKLYFSNPKIDKIQGFNALDEDIQKELLAKYSPISNKISDSIIINMFSSQLIKYLESYNFKVISSKPEDFPKKLDQRHHTLNIAQIELEEFTFEDSLVSNEYNKEYSHKKTLNGVRFNTWLLYNESDTISKLLFFNSEEAKDYIEGFVYHKNKEPFVWYKKTTITPNDAYKVAYQNAITSSQYFFNFLMNKYVWIKSNATDTNYYSMDPKTKIIYSSPEPSDNFDIIEQ